MPYSTGSPIGDAYGIINEVCHQTYVYCEVQVEAVTYQPRCTHHRLIHCSQYLQHTEQLQAGKEHTRLPGVILEQSTKVDSRQDVVSFVAPQSSRRIASTQVVRTYLAALQYKRQEKGCHS